MLPILWCTLNSPLSILSILSTANGRLSTSFCNMPNINCLTKRVLIFKKISAVNYNLSNLIHTDHCQLFTDHCPLTTVHLPLFTDQCPLTTVHLPLFTDHCPPCPISVHILIATLIQWSKFILKKIGGKSEKTWWRDATKVHHHPTECTKSVGQVSS